MADDQQISRERNRGGERGRLARWLVRPHIKTVAGWQRSLAYVRALQSRGESGRQTGSDWQPRALKLLADVDIQRPIIEQFLADLPTEVHGAPAITDLSAGMREVLFRIEALREKLLH
jgi:hypothetical protein